MQQPQPSVLPGILGKCCSMMLHATTPESGKSVTRMLPGKIILPLLLQGEFLKFLGDGVEIFVS